VPTTKPDNRPAFLFYPDDWLAEWTLKLVGFQGKGLAIELLAHMFRLPFRGELRNSNHMPLSLQEICDLVGRPVAEVEPILKQLLDKGVFSTTNNGCTYSRRLVREECERRSKVKAGTIGADKRWHSEAVAEGMANDGSSVSSSVSVPSSDARTDDSGRPESLSDFKPSDADLAAVADYWNGKERLFHYHGCQTLTTQRKKHLRARFKEVLWRENWQKVIDMCETSDFLILECRPFDFTWIIKNPENYAKILEGRYQSKTKATRTVADEVREALGGKDGAH
jgi:hypothetical protein